MKTEPKRLKDDPKFSELLHEGDVGEFPAGIDLEQGLVALKASTAAVHLNSGTTLNATTYVGGALLLGVGFAAGMWVEKQRVDETRVELQVPVVVQEPNSEPAVEVMVDKDKDPEPKLKVVSPKVQPAVDTLAPQIQILKNAGIAFEAQDYRAVLRDLDRLKGELEPEAQLLSLRAQLALGEVQKTIEALRRAIGDPKLRAERGALYRLLGDALWETDSCDEASAAYRRALMYPLSALEKSSIQAALIRCETVEKLQRD